MGATFDNFNGVLFVTGSLDRGADQELIQALSKYSQATPAPQRVADMSNVRWLTPSGGKALIAAGQEASEKGGKLRILASRHVMQTLNLLGAKTWLSIESCLTPNPKPGSEPEPKPAPSPTPAPALVQSAPAAPAPAVIEKRAPQARETIAAATPPQAAAVVPAALQSDGGHSVAAPAPPGQPTATASALLKAVPAPDAAPPVASRTGAPLAGPTEELSRGALLLRVLYPNRRYNFHFGNGESVLGIVRERVGGPWVLVETSGTRKIVNLDVVDY